MVHTTGPVKGATDRQKDCSHIKNQIRGALDILSLARHYGLDPKRSGSQWVCSAPHREDRVPSLYLDPRTHEFYDQGDEHGGDALAFIGLMERLDYRGKDFRRIMEIASELTGIPLTAMSPQEIEAYRRERVALDALTMAAKYFHNRLPLEIRERLKAERGLDDETIDAFGIGFDDGTSWSWLSSQGISKEDALATGLFVQTSRSMRSYFHGRITIPYWQGHRVVWMSGRKTDQTANEKWEQPKYKNLRTPSESCPYISPGLRPESIYQATSAHHEGPVVLTEGAFDALAAFQAGFDAWAIGSNNLPEKKRDELLERLGPRDVVIALDSHKGNEKSVRKLARIFSDRGRMTRIASLPRQSDIEKVDLSSYFASEGLAPVRELIVEAPSHAEWSLAQIDAQSGEKVVQEQLMDHLGAFAQCDVLVKDMAIAAAEKRFKKLGVTKTSLKTAMAQAGGAATVDTLRREGRPRTAETGWESQLQQTKEGLTKRSASNLRLILDNDPELSGAFGMNLRTEQIEVLRPVLGQPAGPLKDEGATAIQDHISGTLQAEFGFQEVCRMLGLVASDHEFDPFLNKMRAVPWDKVPRLETWLSDVLKIEQSEYLAKAGKWWLIGMAARTLRPGCQCDYALILEGGQGVTKTSFFNALVGADFVRNFVARDVNSKDAFTNLEGPAIVLLDELASMRRSDRDALKTFLTARTDTFRRAYGHFDKKMDRRCVFAGTTNEYNWNRDPTGARRFWPVRCEGEADIALLEQIAPQLLAEALTRAEAGERYYPKREEEERLFEPEQKARYANDVWWETLGPLLEARAGLIEDGRLLPVTPGQCLAALGIDPKDQSKDDDRRVREMLQAAGWTAGRPRHRGGQKRAYSPPSRGQNVTVDIDWPEIPLPTNG